MIARHCPDCPEEFYVLDFPPEWTEAVGPYELTLVASRSAWEVEMMRHWRERHPGRMESLGLSEEAVIAEARASMDRMVKSVADRFTTGRG